MNTKVQYARIPDKEDTAYGRLNDGVLEVIGHTGIGGWRDNDAGQLLTVDMADPELKLLTPENLDGLDDYAGFVAELGVVVEAVLEDAP